MNCFVPLRMKVDDQSILFWLTFTVKNSRIVSYRIQFPDTEQCTKLKLEGYKKMCEWESMSSSMCLPLQHIFMMFLWSVVGMLAV